MIVKEKMGMDRVTTVAGLRGSKALVVGLGKTGLAVAGFLARAGSHVTATDLLPESKLKGLGDIERLGVRVEAGVEDPAEFLEEGGSVIISPGVPFETAWIKGLVERGVEVISDVEFACRYIKEPVIAVTGTNGKSTTTALIGRILEASGRDVFVGGNIGTPAVEYLEGDAADFVVLEISSFHLEAVTTFRPFIGVLLNITPDHLDRYSGFEHYAEIKQRIFSNQTGDDYAVVNIADPVVARAVSADRFKGRLIPFTSSGIIGEGLYLKDGEIVFAGGQAEEIYPAGGPGLSGLHNIENVMAAIAVAKVCGVSRDIIARAIGDFEGLAHRMEFIREVGGVRYVNDSKATNVGAVIKGLEGIDGKVVLIAGGRDKHGDYGLLRDAVSDKVRHLILIGEARFKMEAALGASTETSLANGLCEAMGIATIEARPGDIVLLCPACSSFDMFESFEERGELFRGLVEALPER